MPPTNNNTGPLINPITGLNSNNNLNPQNPNTAGFSVPPVSTASNNGLPSQQTPSSLPSYINTRNIVHFFVPQIGVVNMYVNPQEISYAYKKIIQNTQTKGGFMLQYWGEDMPRLTLNGHTASSGVEGLNVLYEVYRAEQYVFDSIGLTIASNNSISGLSDLFANLGNVGNAIGSATSGLFDLNPLTQSILPRNIPTLASLAFTVEIYYSGWVFRGYFDNMTVTESAERLGLMTYNIGFVVTQRRGYRTNTMPWQKSALYNDPSSSPLTFDGTLTTK